MIRKFTIVLILFSIFTCVQTASAVTGNGQITVISSGTPLPGTTVTLISKETGTEITTAKTDSSGIATVSVDEGTYIVEVGEGENKTQTEISITGGQTSSVTVDLPPISMPPPFTYRPTVTVTYGNEQTDDFPVTGSEDRITDTINGVQGPTDVRPGDPDDLNDRFDFDFDWNQTSGTFAFGVGESDSVHPFVNVTVGRADVSFRNRNLANPSSTNLFQGDGFVIGVGGDVVITNGNFFGGGGYNFTGYYNVDLERARALTAPGGIVTLDQIEASYYAHQVRGFVGYRVGPVYPYGGVTFWFREMTIEGIQEADFSQTAGFPVIRRIEFTNEFDDNAAAALIGAMIRAGHFVVGGEATFGGDFTTFRLNAGVGL
jgi:hypothetical protein